MESTDTSIDEWSSAGTNKEDREKRGNTIGVEDVEDLLRQRDHGRRSSMLPRYLRSDVET
jgi:hypothetical protein